LPVDDPLNIALNRSLDTYIMAKETGNFQDDTTSQLLKSHVIIPTDLFTIVFGNSEHLINSGTARTLNSDMGYVRDLWSFGILGFIIFISPFLVTIYKTQRYKTTDQSSNAVLIFSLLLLLFHAKEPVLYVRMLWSVYSLLLAVFLLNRETINIRRKSVLPQA
jgi:hypothetical protein